MQVAVARHQTRCGTLGKSSVKACWLCGLELCALETSVPPLPPAPCSQVDAIREAMHLGLWEGRPVVSAPGGLGWEIALFQNIVVPPAPFLPFLSSSRKKSLKLNGSRGGIFSKCQCNLWYITAKCDHLSARL